METASSHTWYQVSLCPRVMKVSFFSTVRSSDEGDRWWQNTRRCAARRKCGSVAQIQIGVNTIKLY